MGRRLVEKLDVLMVVNFDEGDTDLAGPQLLEVVALVETEQIVPEGDGLGKV
jgi:hypothetical protein